MGGRAAMAACGFFAVPVGIMPPVPTESGNDTGGVWHADFWYRRELIGTLLSRASGLRVPDRIDLIRPEHIIRYTTGKPLDSDPGTAYAYSNFGYCMLGRVVEAISGKSYELPAYYRCWTRNLLGIRARENLYQLATCAYPTLHLGPR